jgi:hypothetical protein
MTGGTRTISVLGITSTCKCIKVFMEVVANEISRVGVYNSVSVHFVKLGNKNLCKRYCY